MTGGPKQYCHKPGCSQRVPIGHAYCENHRIPESAVRPNAHTRGYGARWSKAAAAFLKEHPLCNHCPAPATLVDHIIPADIAPKMFWDRSNWQGLCHDCHNRKRKDDDQLRHSVKEASGQQLSLAFQTFKDEQSRNSNKNKGVGG